MGWVIRSEADLDTEVEEAKREARAAFGKDEIYLEKLVERARHVEAQILGDTHGNVVHLFERDCSVQRRNQKVVERAPAPYLSEAKRIEISEHALKIGIKAQIHLLSGEKIGTPESGVPPQEEIKLNGHAMQCRITTEDPEQNFIPDYGRITAYRGAQGFGIRLDGGTAYSGAVINRFYSWRRDQPDVS